MVRKNMLRGIIVAALALSVSAGPAVAQDSDGADQEKIRIGLATAAYDLTDFFGQLDFGIRQGLTDRGVNYDIFLQPSATLAAQDEQLNNHQTLLTLGVDYLVSAPTVPVAMVSAYERANDLGIPVLIAQFIEPVEGVEILKYSGVTHENAGEQVAAYIIDYLGGEGQVAILHGEAGSPVTAGRTLHAIPILEAGGLEVVAEEYADFERDIAFRKVEEILARNPEVDFIFGGSSAMAAGAIAALDALGLDIPVVGVGGTLEELQNLLAGKQQATALRDPAVMGDALAEAIWLDLQGRSDEIELVSNNDHTMLDSCEDVVEHANRALFDLAGVPWPEC